MDEDFVLLACRPGETGSLVWVRLGNCRNQSLIAAFDRVHDKLAEALASGQRVIEIR
jgi:predicted nuclease of predicted toxin-antitoxin system